MKYLSIFLALLCFSAAVNAAPETGASNQKKPLPVVTMKVRNVSLLESLNLITEITGMKWRVSGNVVVVLPKDHPEGAIQTRMYNTLPGTLSKVDQLRAEIK